MRGEQSNITCDLMVIGAGMTGMAAAFFAASRGIDTVQVGMTSELDFSSGLLDLMAVHPIEEGRLWENPWQAIDALVRDCPRHPYAFLDRGEMNTAMSDFLVLLKQGGLPYHREPDRNVMVITSVGTLKPTYAVPVTVQNGIRSLQEKASCAIIDFHGLRGFSGLQIVETLKNDWPDLHTHRVTFPKSTGELYPEHMANRLELPEARAQLAEAIRPHINRAGYVGLPAILGIYETKTVFDDLQERLRRPLFEIPTMPPSISGLRLKNIFVRQLPLRGVRTFFHHKILKASYIAKKGFRFEVGPQKTVFIVHAKGAILASGRFFGRGLCADRKRITETVFDLPVYQPADRAHWHHKSFLIPEGHPINLSGVETDDQFRPLGADGRPAFSNLFAAGSILAHQDWKRMKCGSGLAITTAYGAVKAFERIAN